MVGRLLLWLSPEYRDTHGEKHTPLISQMELKAVTAACDSSCSFLLFFGAPVSLSEAELRMLPSQEGLQHWLWMGVKACTVCPSVFII